MRERTKRLRGCRCPGGLPRDDDGRLIQYTTGCFRGNCTEWRCQACAGLLGSAGPPWCKCHGGYARWFRYPGMDNKYRRWDQETVQLITKRVAIKPSMAKRSLGKSKPKKRES